MLPAVSDITREVDRAFLLIGGACLVLFLAITVAMVWFAVKYRRGRARTTSQVKTHFGLEVTWTVIPTIIVMWMFYVGYQGFAMMRTVPDDHMVVNVTGKQWVWSYHYPEERIDSSEMVVPVNTPVLVNLTSPPEDVIHSFYIPAFRVKEDALPGKATKLWFEARREGSYTILCAEFCGKDHSQMISLLKVVSAEQYDQWVMETQRKRYRPLEREAMMNPDHPGFGEDELNIDAQAIYGAFCASCHGAKGDGAGLPGEARDFAAKEGWKRSPKATDIYRTLTEGIAGTRMRAYPNFTPWERVALAHYVRSFVTDPPEDTDEDYQALVAEYGLDKIQPPKETIPIERAMEILVREAGAAGAPETDRPTARAGQTP